MPEYDSLNVHVGTLQKAEGLRAIRRIKTQTVFRRQRPRSLTYRCRVTIALPHRVHDANASLRARTTELDAGTAYQRHGFAAESQRGPPIGTEPRRDAYRDDVGGPPEPRDAEGDAGGRSTCAQRNDDRVGR